jgi:hypothetical protein
VTDVTHKWLVLVYRLPARPTAARMRVWRQLRRLGALPVGGGAWVLPHRRQTRDGVERLRADIVARQGEAALFAADPLDAGAAADLVAAFREAREADFVALRRDAKSRGKGPTAAPRVARELARRLVQLQSIDFFGAPSAGAAAEAVAAATYRRESKGYKKGSRRAVRRRASGRRRSG